MGIRAFCNNYKNILKVNDNSCINRFLDIFNTAVVTYALLQVNDFGIAETFRAFKYITPVCLAYMSDFIGLMKKKVFDSLVLRSFLSHWIVD